MKRIIAIMAVCLFMLASCEVAPTDILGEQGASPDTEEVTDTELHEETDESSEDITSADTEPDTEPTETTADTEAETTADTEAETTADTEAETTAETEAETTVETTVETEAVTDTEEPPIIQTCQLTEIILDDVTYSFADDEEIIALNPGAVGAMCITGVVLGPANVRDVMIATWGEDFSSWTLDKLCEEAIFYSQMWKSEGMPIWGDGTFPYEICLFHPVSSDELGRANEVLLIGIDADHNPIGFAIVEGTVPYAN